MVTFFDLIVIAVVGLLAFTGLRRGLIEEAFKLAGIILASYLGAKLYPLGAQLIRGFTPFSEGVLTVIGFLIVFLVIYLSVQLIAGLLKRLVRTFNLAWADRLAGLGFGTVKALVIMAIVVWIISVFSELGIAQKLEQSSPGYIYLQRFERKVIRVLDIEDEMALLRKNIRKIFMLDRETGIRVENPINPVPKGFELHESTDKPSGGI